MKSIFVLFDWLFIALAALFVATQLVVPAVRGLPLFPIFRKRPRKVAVKLAEAEEKGELDAAEERLRMGKRNP